MQFPTHLPLHGDTSDDGLLEQLSFFGLNQSSQGALSLAPPAHTSYTVQGTVYAGYNNARVPSNMSNQTAVYGGITHHNASGIGFPRDAPTSTTYYPMSEQAFQYGENAHSTASNAIRGTCGTTVDHPTVPNQTIAYGGTVYHNAPTMGPRPTHGNTVNHDTRSQVLPPYDRGASEQVLPYDVNMPNATLNVGIHNAYSSAVNYNMANYVGGYGGIAPNGTPYLGVHGALPPAQYNQHQTGALSGHNNMANTDMHGPLPASQYHQYHIDPPVGHENMANVQTHAPPAPAPDNEYQFGLSAGSETYNTPPMSSFSHLPVVAVNGVVHSPIEHVAASDLSSANGLAAEVVPSPGNDGTIADLPVETDDVDSPSSPSARSDTAFSEIPGTPISSTTVESMENNAPPAEVSDELGYSVIPRLQTDYFEDLVPPPLYTRKDQTTWSALANGPGRSANNHIIIFKRRGDTRFSLWGVPMLDCIDPSSRLLLDPEERMDCLKGNSDPHIFLKMLWPGYERLAYLKPLPVRTSDNQIIKRTELARVIARAFSQFIKRCADAEYLFEDPRWKLGEGGLSFNDVSLSCIWNPEGNIWVPAFRCLYRKPWLTPPEPTVGTATANVSK